MDSNVNNITGRIQPKEYLQIIIFLLGACEQKDDIIKSLEQRNRELETQSKNKS